MFFTKLDITEERHFLCGVLDKFPQTILYKEFRIGVV